MFWQRWDTYIWNTISKGKCYFEPSVWILMILGKQVLKSHKNGDNIFGSCLLGASKAQSKMVMSSLIFQRGNAGKANGLEWYHSVTLITQLWTKSPNPAVKNQNNFKTIPSAPPPKNSPSAKENKKWHNWLQQVLKKHVQKYPQRKNTT